MRLDSALIVISDDRLPETWEATPSGWPQAVLITSTSQFDRACVKTWVA